MSSAYKPETGRLCFSNRGCAAASWTSPRTRAYCRFKCACGTTQGANAGRCRKRHRKQRSVKRRRSSAGRWFKSTTTDRAATSTIDAWQRLRQGEITPNKLPYSANKQLQRYLKNPHNLNLLYEHSAPFLFHVTEQLENANLPLELALLPIVESNYDPLAYSPSHAVGLWQFIPSTATSLGLERSRWYEGRRYSLPPWPISAI